MNPHLKNARFFAKLLDSQFGIGKFRFGLDSIIGFIPGLGDIVGLCLSTYLVYVGYTMRIPSNRLAQMVANVVLDFVLGTVPLVGDIGDLFFKANMRNLQILEEFAEDNVIEGEIVE